MSAKIGHFVKASGHYDKSQSGEIWRRWGGFIVAFLSSKILDVFELGQNPVSYSLDFGLFQPPGALLLSECRSIDPFFHLRYTLWLGIQMSNMLLSGT